MPEVVVGSWNVHSGVDGWGRPFDVVEGCRAIDADVLVLEETWRAHGERGVAATVGEALGYRVEEKAISNATMYRRSPRGHREESKWGPPLWSQALRGAEVEKRSPPGPPPDVGSAESGAANGKAKLGRSIFVARGQVGLAVLSRLEVTAVHSWELGARLGDATCRCALGVEVVVASSADSGHTHLLVVGTHLSHLRHASFAQVARLRSGLRERKDPGLPAVLLGDMNLPGPAIAAMFRGWRKVLRGSTWPAWRPVGQPDHVLVEPRISASAEVLRVEGSDHLPVRARISLG